MKNEVRVGVVFLKIINLQGSHSTVAVHCYEIRAHKPRLFKKIKINALFLLLDTLEYSYE